MERFELPELGTPAIVLIVFIVGAILIIAWGVYSAPVMTEEEEEWDRFYDEMYKSQRPPNPQRGNGL